MTRSHVALLVLTLLGCGSGDESPPSTATQQAAPPTTTPGEEGTTSAPAIEPTTGERTTTASPPSAPTAIDVAHVGWAERERRTFVLQGAARGVVRGIGIAPGGTHVAVGSSTGVVTMLDAATGEVRASERIARTSNAWFDLDVMGDVALVASWGDAGTGVELWRWRAGARIDVAALNELVEDQAQVALSPRGDRFAIGTNYGLHVGRTGNGRITTTTEGHHPGALSWPHAGAIVEEVEDDSPHRVDVHVYDPQTLAELWTLQVTAAAIVRPVGDRILLLDRDDVIVRALPGGEERARLPHGLEGATRIVVSREGDRVVVSNDAASVMILLATGARTEIPTGRALWVSPRNVLVEAEDGSVRRWALDRAHLGAHVVPPRIVETEYEPEPWNFMAIDATGTVVSVRGARVEIVQPNGTHHEFAHGGEQSVWSVSVDPARSGLAIGGRFGVQGWRASGVRDTTCAGATSSMVVAWPEGVVVTDTECDLATGDRAGRRRFAVSDDARFVVEEDGSFLDRSTSRRVQLDGHTDLFCHEGDDCSGSAAIGPAGTAVVMQLHFDEENVQPVHETTNGRRIGWMRYGAAYTFAPDGAWVAYAGARSLRVIGLLGEAHDERTLVGSDEYDEDEDETAAIAVLAASPDGGSLAWTRGNGHRVSVVAVSDGHETWHTSIGARVLELRWSSSGAQLALRTEHEIRILDVGSDSPGRTLAPAHGDLQIACSERVLWWIRDASDGGFEVIDLGACRGRDRALPRLAAAAQLVSIDEGIVRVRRLDDGSELVIRTLHEDAVRRHHLAHDAEGHWWTDEPTSEAAPVPTWVRHGDGRGGETTPLDPAMRRDDLLTRFFARQ